MQYASEILGKEPSSSMEAASGKTKCRRDIRLISTNLVSTNYPRSFDFIPLNCYLVSFDEAEFPRASPVPPLYFQHIVLSSSVILDLSTSFCINILQADSHHG